MPNEHDAAKSHHASSPLESRFPERTRVLLGNTGAMLLGRTCGLVANLTLVRLLIDCLGAETYGMWAACSHLLAYGTILDLGIGLGLQNAVSHADTLERRVTLSAAGRRATFLLLGMSSATLAAYGLLAARWPSAILWIFGRALNSAKQDTGLVLVGLAALVIASQLVLQIPVKMAAGLQRMARPVLAQGVAALAGVALFPHLVVAGAPPLGALAFAVLLPVVTPAIVASRVLQGSGLEWPTSPSQPTSSVGPTVLRTGLTIFVSQIGYIVVFQTDVIIVSALRGPMEAGRYEVCARLLSIPVILQGILLGALWPAFAQSWAARDLTWVRNTYYKALLLMLCILAPSVILLAIYSGKIIPLWTGNAGFAPDSRLVWCYSLFVGSSLWAGLHATALNAIGSTGVTAVAATIQAGLNLVSVLLAAHYGVWAIALASGIVAIVVNGIPLFAAWNTACRERATSARG